jgi:hypothetical protein
MVRLRLIIRKKKWNTYERYKSNNKSKRWYLDREW